MTATGGAGNRRKIRKCLGGLGPDITLDQLHGIGHQRYLPGQPYRAADLDGLGVGPDGLWGFGGMNGASHGVPSGVRR